jgi:hypothetical protein
VGFPDAPVVVVVAGAALAVIVAVFVAIGAEGILSGFSVTAGCSLFGSEDWYTAPEENWMPP